MHHGDDEVARLLRWHARGDLTRGDHLGQLDLESGDARQGPLHARGGRDKPGDGAFEAQLIQLGMLLGEAHVDLQLCMECLAEVTAPVDRRIPVGKEDPEAFGEQRIVEGHLVGEVGVEGWRLHLHAPRHLP